MNRCASWIGSLVCVGLLSLPALGQEQPPEKTAEEICRSELSREQLDNPPQRKTKYEAAAEPVRIKLKDIKLVEQKYAALVRVELPHHGNGTAETLRYDQELWPLQYVAGVPFLGGGWNPDAPRDLWLPKVIKHAPDDHRPDQQELDLFASPEFLKLWDFPGNLVSPSENQPDAHVQRYFHLLAPTPELAERRCRALLTLLDQGFTRPIGLGLWQRREELCKSLVAVERRLPEERAKVTALNEKLQQYQEFPPDLLAGLRVQLLQMEADLAGVKARIAAWDKLLAVKGLREERRQQMQEAKETAEVDLAGLEARHAKSAEFVDKVKERMALVVERDEARGIAQGSRNKQENLKQAIQRIDAELKAFSPVVIPEDRVTIHPVEWTQTER